MQEDPELKGRSTEIGDPSSTIDPYTDGLYAVSLNNEQIESCGNFLNSFYEKISKKEGGRRITRNAFTMFKGAMFALGTKKLNNFEWKEHCASSLREIFHEWDGRDRLCSEFCDFFRDKGTKLSDIESGLFKDFWEYYGYLCGIDHHEADKIMHSLRAIRKDQSLKLEDCYEDDVFISIVKEFFSKLSQIIALAGTRT